MSFELDNTATSAVTPSEQLLSQLLLLAAENLDLTKTQHEAADESYQAVAAWLGAEESPLSQYSILLYPQGSFPLGTVVKPLGKDDFDLDATCLLFVPRTIPPGELKRMVGNRLREHRVYKELLEEKNRCWRLNYAREFHLDIIPARPDPFSLDKDAIEISDKELMNWYGSNPKGYIKWFHSLPHLALNILSINKHSADVEPLPPHDDYLPRTVLQAAVQILKRHRDIIFSKRKDCESAPVSILITTLAARAYCGERSLISFVRTLPMRMRQLIDYSNGYAFVENPSNPGENFADKWRDNPERETAFYEWVDRLECDIGSLEKAAGMPNIQTALSQFIGEKRASLVLTRLGEETKRSRTSGLKVSTSTGLVGVKSGIVPRNSTFYGD